MNECLKRVGCVITFVSAIFAAAAVPGPRCYEPVNPWGVYFGGALFFLGFSGVILSIINRSISGSFRKKGSSCIISWGLLLAALTLPALFPFLEGSLPDSFFIYLEGNFGGLLLLGLGILTIILFLMGKFPWGTVLSLMALGIFVVRVSVIIPFCS